MSVILTQQGRQALDDAQEEAKQGGVGQVRTEHLLLGLMRVSDSHAMRILQKLETSAKQVQEGVKFILEPLPQPELAEAIDYSPRAKKVLELAIDEMRWLRQRNVGTQHLLLGLIREGEGLAAWALDRVGVTLEAVREAARNLPDNGVESEE